MTNNWVDIKNANVVLVMGANSAEAHPCGFKWVIEVKVKHKARLIAVDARVPGSGRSLSRRLSRAAGDSRWRSVSMGE
jgi:anaerobic selenocysteine-containing dehydrogenase